MYFVFPEQCKKFKCFFRKIYTAYLQTKNVSMEAALLTILICVAVVGGDYVGQSVGGEVGPGNYTYYTLRQAGHVQMVLTSAAGDADLYVADASNERPTFLLDEHQLSSTTCGLDIVDIPASFSRPVHIGVYGHPNYLLSVYTMDGVIVEDTEEDYFKETDYEARNEESDERADDRRSKRSSGKQSGGFEEYLREGSPLRIILTVLGSIIEVLLEVLL